MNRLPALLFLAGLALAAPRANAEELPDYRRPDAFAAAGEPSPLVARQVAILLAEAGGEADDAWRTLGGIGRAAVPAVVDALPRAGWFGRSLLMNALAESGVPEVEPVLAAGAADPAWAVREAAATGLAKTDSLTAARALLARAADESWRVRTTVATGVRRHVTRGNLSREEALPVLLGLARDSDRDVHYQAIVELGLLRAPEALDLFLAGYREGDERLREASLDALVRLPSAREELLAALREAMRAADEDEFLKAAEKVAELAGAELLADPTVRDRLLRGLHSSSGGITKLTKIFEKVGPPAVPVLLEDLRRNYRMPRQGPPVEDPAQPVLDTIQAILGADAAPILAEILTEWEEALPARRYAVLLARRYHAKQMAKTLTESFLKESFADLRAPLLEAIDAANPPDLDRYVRAALRDSNAYVRRAALETLARHPELDLSDDLLAAARAETSYALLANRLMNTLAKRSREKAYEVAKEYLGRSDPEFREVGAAGMRLGPDADAVVAELTRAWSLEKGLYRDRDYDLPPEGIAAARAKIGAMILASAVDRAGAGALPLVTQAVRDPDPIVREKAFAALADIEGPEATRVALEALAAEKDPLPRREARRAVVGRNAPEVREVVQRALAGDDAAERLGMLEALRAVPGAPLPPVVAEALEAGEWEPEARPVAAEALRARHDPADLPVFLRLVRQGRIPAVRAEAVQALGESGDPRATDPLLSLLPPAGRSIGVLEPEEQQIAALAIMALGDLRAEAAVPRLLALLATEWPLALTDTTEDRRHFDTAARIFVALGQIGDRRAIAPLLDLLFTPELYRWFGLLENRPARRGRNLLGTLLGALVRFPDDVLAAEARAAIGRRKESGEAWRIDEGYLGWLAGVLRDPRPERVARNHPRRRTAAEFERLVLDVVPRRTAEDAAALEGLVVRAVNDGDWAGAAEEKARANALSRTLDPVTFEEDGAAHRAEVDYYRGLALLEAGKEEEGWRAYEAGRARDPEDADVLNLYAWFLAATGRRPEEALETALEAGRRSPSAPYILDTIGWAYHRLGREEEAWWKLLDAERLDAKQAEASGGTRYPEPLYAWHLAAVAAAAGHPDSAADWLTAALERDDTLADAARAAPEFASLREDGRLEALIRRVLSPDGTPASPGEDTGNDER